MKFNSFLPVLLFSGIASSTFADDGSTSACDLSQALDPTSPCSLEDLSDAELEQCCLERGFELARQGGAGEAEEGRSVATTVLLLIARIPRSTYTS